VDTRINVAHKRRANSANKLRSAADNSNAATVGLLDDRVAFGHCKGCTRKCECDRKLRGTRDRPMGVRDGLTTWNASVELGGRVRGDLDVRVCAKIGESEKLANIYQRDKMSRTIHIDTDKHTGHTLADPIRNICEIVE